MRRSLVILAVVVLVVLAVAWIIGGGRAVPSGPQPITWHKQPCAHCKMLIEEPAHAAQLITEDGEVLSFDDPGCALRHLADHHPAVRELWFHHATEDRWLSASEVGFITGGDTPMASGLLAVDRTKPGALTLEAAQALTARANQANQETMR